MESEDIELLETILKALVSQPEKVEVKRTTDNMGVLLTAKVGDGDAGFVIGKQGQCIKAIRTILFYSGLKSRSRINIKLDVPEVPPERSSGDRPRGRKSTDDFQL